jgi:hypothetical protein
MFGEPLILLDICIEFAIIFCRIENAKILNDTRKDFM